MFALNVVCENTKNGEKAPKIKPLGLFYSLLPNSELRIPV
jgi:hypothetical protein